jgi:hypothetical protein
LSGQSSLADLVVEDLGRGAGQRLQPGVLQSSEVGREVDLGTSGPFKDLERAEGVDVNLRRTGPHGGHDVDVVVAVELGVNAPCRQTSVAPLASASRTRSLISSSVRR